MTAEKTKPRPLKKPKPIPRISDAEWVVMKVVWDRGAATANQVVAELVEQTDWKPKTIQTLLSRLVQKGALQAEKQGREYLFQPRVSAEDCEHAAMRSFLGRFFDGDLAPFLARFVEREKLTPEEIEELKQILDGKKL